MDAVEKVIQAFHTANEKEFHVCGTRFDYGVGFCFTKDKITYYAHAWPCRDFSKPFEFANGTWGARFGAFSFDKECSNGEIDFFSREKLSELLYDYGAGNEAEGLTDCWGDCWQDEIVCLWTAELEESSIPTHSVSKWPIPTWKDCRDLIVEFCNSKSFLFDNIDDYIKYEDLTCRLDPFESRLNDFQSSEYRAALDGALNNLVVVDNVPNDSFIVDRYPLIAKTRIYQSFLTKVSTNSQIETNEPSVIANAAKKTVHAGIPMNSDKTSSYIILDRKPDVETLRHCGHLWCPSAVVDGQHVGLVIHVGLIGSRSGQFPYVYDIRLGRTLDSPASFNKEYRGVGGWVSESGETYGYKTCVGEDAVFEFLENHTRLTGNGCWVDINVDPHHHQGNRVSEEKTIEYLESVQTPSYEIVEPDSVLQYGEFFWNPDCHWDSNHPNGTLIRHIDGADYEVYSVTEQDAKAMGLDWFETSIGRGKNGEPVPNVAGTGYLDEGYDVVRTLVDEHPAWIRCNPPYSGDAANGIKSLDEAIGECRRISQERAVFEHEPAAVAEAARKAVRAGIPMESAREHLMRH